MAESPNSGNLFTVAEASKAGANKEQSNLGDAVKAFRAVKEGKPAPKAVVPTVRSSVEKASESVDVIKVPGISDRPEPTSAEPPPNPVGQPPSADKPNAGAPPPPPAPPPADVKPPAPVASPTPEPAKPEGPLSKGWAEIAKREAQNRREAEKIKAERLALQAEREAVEKARTSKAAELEAKLKTDPFGALAEMGWTTETLLQKAKGENVVVQAPPQAVPMPPQKMPEKSGPVLTPESVNETVQQALAVKDYMYACMNELNKDDFKLLRSHPNAEAEIREFVHLVAKTRGQVLHPTQVATILQKQYRDTLSAQVSSPAIQEALGITFVSPQQAVSSSQADSPAQPRKVAKTLSSSLASAPAQSGPPAPKTDMQKIAEAAQVLRQLRQR